VLSSETYALEKQLAVERRLVAALTSENRGLREQLTAREQETAAAVEQLRVAEALHVAKLTRQSKAHAQQLAATRDELAAAEHRLTEAESTYALQLREQASSTAHTIADVEAQAEAKQRTHASEVRHLNEELEQGHQRLRDAADQAEAMERRIQMEQAKAVALQASHEHDLTALRGKLSEQKDVIDGLVDANRRLTAQLERGIAQRATLQTRLEDEKRRADVVGRLGKVLDKFDD